jgi:uncharacterized membrane protein (DUF485 family)
MKTEKKSNGEFFGVIVIIIILILGGIYIWHSEYKNIINKTPETTNQNSSIQ